MWNMTCLKADLPWEEALRVVGPIFDDNDAGMARQVLPCNLLKV